MGIGQTALTTGIVAATGITTMSLARHGLGEHGSPVAAGISGLASGGLVLTGLAVAMLGRRARPLGLGIVGATTVGHLVGAALAFRDLPPEKLYAR